MLFVGAKIFLAFPRTLAELGGPAAWMIVLIGGLTASLTVIAILGVLTHFPGRSLPEATEAVLGPVIGSLVNLAYAAFFYFVGFIGLREFSENIVAAILPRTPLPAVLIAFLAVIVYGCLLGAEAIARTAWFVAPFTVAGVIALLGGGLVTYRATNALYPFWGPGGLEIAGWGVLSVSLFSEILIVGVLGAELRQREKLVKAAWWSLLMGGLFLLGTVLVHLVVFPYPSSARVSFPLLEISRLIVTGRWLQRVESVFFVIWVMVGALKVSVAHYGCCRTLAHIVRLPRYQYLVIPLAVTLYSASLLPPNLTTAVDLDANILRSVGWIISLALPLLTWLVAVLRNGRRAGRAA